MFKSPLYLIGEWGTESDLIKYPNIFNFIDEKWDQEVRDVVNNYLNEGSPLLYGPGVVYCQFGCKETQKILCLRTDWVYVWPEILSHYVEKHNIRLPNEFVEHCRKRQNGFGNKIFRKFHCFKFYLNLFICGGNDSISEEWWLQQRDLKN